MTIRTGCAAVYGLGALMAGGRGQLGFLRPTFAPEDDGGGDDDAGGGDGGFSLPDDTPFDDGFEPDGGGADAREPAEGDGDPPGEARTPRTPEELAEENRRLRAALNSTRARQRIAGRQRDDAGLDDEPAPRRQAAAQPEPDAEDFVNPDLNPVEAVAQLQKLVRQYQANEAAREASQAEASRQQQQYAVIQEVMEEYEAGFRAAHPDYGAAMTHLNKAVADELAAFGVPPAHIPGLVRQDYARRIALAIKAGKDPAEVFYQTARNRGYQPAQRANQGGDARGGAAGQKATPEALQRIRAGQKVTSPLSRGSAARGIDAETLAAIDIRSPKGQKAFDGAWEEYERQERARERGRAR